MSPSTPSPTGPVRWQVVVPVKESVRAKSRLAPPHPLSRPTLARAVAEDTLVQVCRALPAAQVVVVTSDPHAGRIADRLGALVVPDPAGGLNAAVRAGLQAGPVPAGTQRPGWAVLLGDLPALRAEDLRAALELCGAHPACVVPDARGTGTVLLTSTVGPPQPRFGPGSAARHAVGATVLHLDLPRLRQDVDTVEDLRAALALGVGTRTAAALGTTDA